MLSAIAFFVIFATTARVEGSCRKISTEDHVVNQCVLEIVNMTLEIPVGEVVERLHPECQAYKCVEENLINMCGMGYNDENQYRLDSFGPNCKETKNPDCSIAVKCAGKPPVIMANKKTPYDISLYG